MNLFALAATSGSRPELHVYAGSSAQRELNIWSKQGCGAAVVSKFSLQSFRVFALSALLLLAIGIPDSSHCPSDSLVAPGVTPPQSGPRTAAARTAQSLGTAPWRQIDTVLVLPQDFGNSADTGQSLGKSREQLVSEAQTAVAMANHYLRPLKVVIKIIEIKDYFAGADPYAPAVAHRNAHEMLQTGINLWNTYQTQNYDLVLVLARRNFKGNYGLAYPAVSCVAQQYSVVFATQGSSAPAMEYSLGHTIAHEVGHYLGMSHDTNTYGDGPTLMAPLFAVHPSGFSNESLAQAAYHSGAGQAGGICLSDIVYGMPGDTDGDGTADLIESQDGSDEFDPGSYVTHLNSPLYTLWNGFLGMINIVELSNPSTIPLTIDVTLFSLAGAAEHTVRFVIPGRKQFDLILNQLPGFRADSYGLFKIAFNGKLEGRTAYYRATPGSYTYEFAFSVPFSNPAYDRTYVSYNTHQPSTNPAELQNQVANWLTLVNLSDHAQSYRVNSFNQAGGVLSSVTVRLAGSGRIDIDGGHGFAGAGVVGLHQIVPVDPQAPYIAQLTRFGSNAPAGYFPSAYRFAFPLTSHAGTGRPVVVPMANLSGEDNWIEISNTLSKTITVSVQLLAADGASLGLQSMQVGALQQWHINAGQILRSSGITSGSAVISASAPNAIVAQSMFYYRNPANGGMTAVFGESMSEALGSALNGSYNLFLGMENLLCLSNTSPAAVQSEISITSPGAVSRKTVTIEANSTVVVNLKSNPEFNLPADTYGFLEVKNSALHAVTGSLLRRRSVGPYFDIAMPTALR